MTKSSINIIIEHKKETTLNHLAGDLRYIVNIMIRNNKIGKKWHMEINRGSTESQELVTFNEALSMWFKEWGDTIPPRARAALKMIVSEFYE